MRPRPTHILIPCPNCLNGSSRSSAPSRSPRAPHPTNPPPPPPPPLTDAQRALQIESFDKVWETVRDQHWDPNLNGVDWNAARAELRPRAEAAQSVAEARAAMTELISKLGQSHFGIIPADTYREVKSRPKAAATEPAAPSADRVPGEDPNTRADTDAPAASNNAAEDHDETESESSAGPGSVGLTIRVVNDVAIITRVQPDSPAALAGIAPGWQIEKINGRRVSVSIARITEGFKDSTMLEAMLALGLQHQVDADQGQTTKLALIDGANQPREIALTSAAPAGQPSKFGNLPTIYVTTDVRRLDGNVGYIAFSAFLDPARVMPIVNQAIADFADTNGIILDLRGNIGGIGIMASGVGNHFVTERNLKLGTMKMRETELSFVLNPRVKPNTKPLAVLVDGVSLSTSEILAGGLQDLGRARIFGTRTGGAALPSQIMKLPNGDGFQFAMANYISTGGSVLEGVGVTPDEVVEPSREALLNGEDPVIAAAKRWIAAQSAH